MTRKNILPSIVTLLLLAALVISSEGAVRGAKAAIDTCASVIIPCLFPFFTVSLLISRSYEHLSVGRLIMTIDIVIVAANSIIFRDISAALYTGIAMYLSGVVIDSLMYGANIATVAFIVTKKTDEVNKTLIEELDRGVTILNGTGGYTGAPQSVLICAVGRRQLTTLKRLVRQSDPNAFLILSEARDIIGAGFSDPLV